MFFLYMEKWGYKYLLKIWKLESKLSVQSRVIWQASVGGLSVQCREMELDLWIFSQGAPCEGRLPALLGHIKRITGATSHWGNWPTENDKSIWKTWPFQWEQQMFPFTGSSYSVWRKGVLCFYLTTQNKMWKSYMTLVIFSCKNTNDFLSIK